MIKPTREQTIAVGILALMLVACSGAIAWCLSQRADAIDEWQTVNDMVSRLEARPSGGSGLDRLANGIAPASAFLGAATPGLAGARLQAYLSQLVTGQNANLVSSGVMPSTREDAADTIRVQATVTTTLATLQKLLYRLESGEPYVFIDGIAIQLPSTSVQRDAAEPALRVTIDLRAFWQKRA